MSITIEIIENNKAKVLDELEEAIERALEAVGLQAENYAKVHLEGHIDTGLLRNSITHALAGHPPAIASYHADKSKGGKSAIGYYGGNAPGGAGEHAVYVGTNVEYAPYVEFGHRTPSGAHVAGVRFLQQAVESHTEEYKQLIEKALKGF